MEKISLRNRHVVLVLLKRKLIADKHLEDTGHETCSMSRQGVRAPPGNLQVPELSGQWGDLPIAGARATIPFLTRL